MKTQGLVLNSLVLTVMLGFAGCDSGTPGSARSVASSSPTQIKGHVLNDDGPVSEARIEARDARGTPVASVELRGGSSYSLTLPAATAYPLTLSAYPASDPGNALKAAVLDATASEQDISPVTTIVTDTALSLGGLTEANLAKAAGAAIALRKKSGGGGGGSNTTTQSFKGDPTKQYGGWH